jgi:hypothetical protein
MLDSSRGNWGCLLVISLFTNNNMLDHIHTKNDVISKEIQLYVQHIILLHINKIINFPITRVLHLWYGLPSIYDSYPQCHALFGSSLVIPYVYSRCGLRHGRRNNALYSLFGQSHLNYTYYCRNPSSYRPSCYKSVSSSISLSASFAWPRLIHSPTRHTTVTAMGQAKAQIWAPIFSPQQIMNSTVTCTYFPRAAHVAYDRQLFDTLDTHYLRECHLRSR